MARRAVGLHASAIAIACSIAGCGLLLDYDPPDVRRDGGSAMDGGAIDAAIGDASLRVDGGDGGTVSPCDGLTDGDDCTGATSGPARRICVDGACVPSSCGDGFVDAAAGETCEPELDPNCDPTTCRFECVSASDCPTLSACLVASCTDHACAYESTHAGTTCTRPDGGSGLCSVDGLCVPPGCGNGIVDGGEECDDTLATDGCHGCVFDCHADADCDDGDPCDGIEHCRAVVDVTTIVGRACVSDLPFECPSPPPCFTGGCEPAGDGSATCALHLDDADGDGFAPEDVCGAGALGGDCDDADPNVHPGAPEACNGIDDDCDGLVDDDTMPVTWCFDADGDGYGAPSTSTTSCMRPSPSHVRDCSDCWDDGDPTRRDVAALVHPMQTTFFTSSYCPTGTGACSFDYDCDGTELEQIPSAVSCGLLAPLVCRTSAGWEGSVPACGETGTYATCHGALIGRLCTSTTTDRQQGCR